VIHPLLRLIATEPQLLADHAEAYADLIGAELGAASAIWKRSVALKAFALCLFGVSTILSGVALMLWAVIPPENIQAPWALVVAPGLPLIAALLCWLVSRNDAAQTAFEGIRRQMRADVAMLREVSAP
jgi:cytochrome c biogenesis factor